jgi:protein-arginine kinase activator protein McsA
VTTATTATTATTVTPEQITRIVELAHRIAVYNQNIQVAESRHEYNQAAYLRDEMVEAVGHLTEHLLREPPASRRADGAVCDRG